MVPSASAWPSFSDEVVCIRLTRIRSLLSSLSLVVSADILPIHVLSMAAEREEIQVQGARWPWIGMQPVMKRSRPNKATGRQQLEALPIIAARIALELALYDKNAVFRSCSVLSFKNEMPHSREPLVKKNKILQLAQAFKIFLWAIVRSFA
jgi:hypothetical protein